MAGERKLKVQILGDASSLKDAFGDAEKGGDKFESGMAKLGGKLKLGLAAAGVAGGAAAVAGFKGALETEAAKANLSASLGLNPADSAKAGDIAGNLYSDNFGASVAGAGDALAAVLQGGLAKVGDADIEALTGKVITFSEVFRQDMTKTVATVSAMLTNGLVPNASAAMDQLTVTMQKVPEILRGEILLSLSEYSPFFAQLGISSEQAMSALVEASKGGTIAIDKTGDALKEMVIRVQNGSVATSTALTELGLDTNKIAQGFATGGPAANAAMNEIVTALARVQDPVKQTQLGVALLGTPFEDLGQNAMPTLSALGEGLADVEGAAQKMTDTVGGTSAAKLETFKRSMETNVNKTMEFAVGWLDKLPGPLQTGIAGFAGFLPMLAPLAPIIGAVIPMLFGQAAGHAAAGTAAAASSGGFFAAAAGVWAVMAPLLPLILAVTAVIAVGYLLVRNWDTIRAVAGAVFGFLGSLIGAVVGAIIGFFGSLIGGVVDFVQKWGVLLMGPIGFIWMFRDQIWGVVQAVVGFFGNLLGNIVGFVQQWGVLLLGPIGFIIKFRDEIWGVIQSVIGFFGNLVGGVAGKVGEVVGWFAGLPGRIFGALGDLAGQLFGFGGSIIDGFKNGVSNAFERIADWFRGIGGRILDLIKSGLGPLGKFLSPKTQYGVMIGKGLGLGVVYGINTQLANVRSAAGALGEAAHPPLSAADLTGATGRLQPFSSAATPATFGGTTGPAGTTRGGVTALQHVENQYISETIDSRIVAQQLGLMVDHAGL